VEDEGVDVFAKGDDDNANACSIRSLRSSTIFCNDPASNSNVSDFELQGG
jgi:hypothetical protein